jgi:chromosome segregation protein
MRLRRVVISGFKTFARRSEVGLEPGITAIVGPNGSGKSNLVDAIRWALGETNARELRGARMDEVIYSGGNGRPRMGFAEVELILDNEEGRLPVDDVEVSVSRRVVRHGDSEFRLNGDRVRLRDVERVLGTTGLTQSGYAVVAQNDIDAIIEASPAQRRALVEQAAGVRSLRAACEDALVRVSQAEVTLRRFEDLLAETEPRLAELATQAGLAREQRELTDQLSRLRGSLAREAWRAARAQLRQAQRRLDAAGQRLEAAATAEAAFAARLAGHRTRLEHHRAAQSEAARDLEAARLFAERATGEQQRNLDRARAGVQARAVAAAALRVAEREAESVAADLAALEEAEGAAEGMAASLDSRRDAAQRDREAADDAQRNAEAALSAAEVALRAAEEARSGADAQVARHAAQLQMFGDAAAAIRERLDASSAHVDGLQRQVDEAAERRGQAERALTDAEAAAAGREAALASARSAVEETQLALDEVRQAARSALARASVLRGQVDGALGGRGAVAAAVVAGDLEGRRLVDCFTVVDPVDGAAIEAALEQHLGAWVVADIDAAAAVLDAGSAREEVLAEGGFAGDTPSAPPGARAALSCVRPGPRAAGALANCLAATWLVADRAQARHAVAVGGGRAILPDGTVVSVAGVRGGGRPGRTLELAADEREAAAAADRALSAERLAESARSAAAAQLAAAETAQRREVERAQAARIEAVEIRAQLAAATEALAGGRRRLDEAHAELAAREAERASLASADASAAERLRDAATRLEEARARADEARQLARAARATAAEVAASVRELEVDAARTAAAVTDRLRRLEAARTVMAQAATRQADAQVRVLAAELTVLGAQARGRAARAVATQSDQSVALSLERLSATAPELAESERAVAALDAERSEVAVVLARAEDERAAAAVEVASASERVAELAEAVRGDDEDEGPEPQAGDADRAEREIVRLERRVAALGPVNALAPEQHDRLAARVEILRAGRDDLGNACADIRVMAARLSLAIDSRFEAVFGAVSVHFHDLFAELFPGGRATLRREEAADIADDTGRNAGGRAGVEILAQPPGKRLQPLSLFSGGERALTALAVILALQQVNPSPFYVFDEVDAPLDDSNVLRFTRLLKRLAAAQQFIVVTHNHITMAAADALHGVTSDGDGVSSVISVRFDAESGETVPEGHVVGLRQSTIRAAV